MRYKRISFLVMLTVLMMIASACATESLNPTSVPPTTVPPTATATSAPTTTTDIEEVEYGLGRSYFDGWCAFYFLEPNGSSD